jgi:acyl carrier protein
MKETNIEDIRQKIKSIIADDLDVNIDIKDIREDVSLYDDGLGLDSIAMVNFIVILEKKFNINFEENEISSKLFSNISDLAGFISSKIKADINGSLA